MVNVEKTTKQKLLEALKEARCIVSGDELATRLGVSRVAIWKNVRALAEEGHRVHSVRKGYFIEGGGDPLGPSVLESRVEFARSASSTMDMARDALRRGRGPGFVAVAESQDAGRARNGYWQSDKGGLYMSYLADPGLPYPLYGRIALSSCLVALLALEKAGISELSVAWPGDIIVGDKKIGGVLIEAHTEAARALMVIGIGVSTESDLHSRAEVITEIMSCLDSSPWLDRNFVSTWESRASDIGRIVSARTPWNLIEGRIKGIGEDASLRIGNEEGEKRIQYGFAITRL